MHTQPNHADIAPEVGPTNNEVSEINKLEDTGDAQIRCSIPDTIPTW